MSATGFGVRDPGAGAGLWLAPFVEGSAALLLGRSAALRLDVGALFPSRRPTYVLENVGAVHRASPVGGRAEIAVEARF